MFTNTEHVTLITIKFVQTIVFKVNKSSLKQIQSA